MDDIDRRLQQIHTTLKITYGTFTEEYAEQYMAAKFFTGTEHVLEIGGNIGRNSLVIARLLGDRANSLVTLECNSAIAKQLEENRDANGLSFHIENSALSQRSLIQKGWTTIPSDTLLDGYQWVNTITVEQLRDKYKIPFDTLVLDCEGAFYYILHDMPEILDGIRLIIVENDYTDLNQKMYVENVLTLEGFTRIFAQAYEGWKWAGIDDFAFYEVWKRE